jgi:glycosylphosphatidylinositol transamidase (GPIT) subunit GPI8
LFDFALLVRRRGAWRVACSLLSTSPPPPRGRFNYRHTANALLVYRSLRRLGLPDSRIVLMLADEHAASAQNVAPGTVFGTDSSADEL